MKYAIVRKRTDGIKDYFQTFFYGFPIYTEDIKKASKFNLADKKQLSKSGYKFVKIK